MREVNWRSTAISQRLDYFRLWLVLFSVLNGIDMVQTWFFFEHEANPLYVQFPSIIFPIKIFWTFFAPAILYISYGKKPRIIYYASLALVLIYVGVVFANAFSIMRLNGVV